jgi:hypothetical protein
MMYYTLNMPEEKYPDTIRQIWSVLDTSTLSLNEKYKAVRKVQKTLSSQVMEKEQDLAYEFEDMTCTVC